MAATATGLLQWDDKDLRVRAPPPPPPPPPPPFFHLAKST